MDGHGEPKTDVAEAARARTAETVMKTIVREGNLEVLMKLLEHFSDSYHRFLWPEGLYSWDGCEVPRIPSGSGKAGLKKTIFSVCDNMDEAVLGAWQGVVVLTPKNHVKQGRQGRSNDC